MRNAGLAPLDAIEVKQRDRDYKRSQERNRARTDNYFKSILKGYSGLNADNYATTEDIDNFTEE